MQEIEVGQVWELPPFYKMTVRKIEVDHVVTWDGIYDKGYRTTIQEFRTLLSDDSWTLVATSDGPVAPNPAIDIFDEACRDLPEGWSVHIYLEAGAGVVYLTDDETDHETVIDIDDATLTEHVRRAIAEAKKRASTPTT